MKKRGVRVNQIREKLTEIEQSVELVREHLPDSFEVFSNLGLLKDGIYKRTEFAIENVFDICALINSDLKLEVPGSDEEIVERLEEKGILSRELKDKIRRMKGFRNIVVHRYGKIDDEIAYEILRNELDDFHQFTEAIEDFLAKESNHPTG